MNIYEISSLLSEWYALPEDVKAECRRSVAVERVAMSMAMEREYVSKEWFYQAQERQNQLAPVKVQ
ncbi:hypothetical protein [Corynebacterium freiburgense]|uniref:hypothetical protein n=1 Tax=Corynebacterium freiburgense TaxID=556548 RepID=UPI00041C2112|nr:hypothetical protein [Corynebacterium freiburgense]WJZ03294.1 hypothetical protein CFREI_10100 [Corynebacterium freiburgense]